MTTATLNSRKVGVVGTGMVGTSFAYALMQRSLATELVLVDIDGERALGEAMDLNHGVPFVRPIEISAGDYQDLAGAHIVVLTAGANQRPGETRLDLLQRNAQICRQIIPQIVQHNPEGVILIASNPVDILTHIAAEISGLPWGRVLGSGTILDTARFRYLIGAHLDVDPRSVHAYIVGEHGDTSVPLWSSANIGGVRISEFETSGGRRIGLADMDRIYTQTRDAAYEIIKRKKATYYAIGLGLLTLVEAILRDQHSVLTVSTPMQGQYDVDGIALSLPAVVGGSGASDVLQLKFSEQELAAFHHSAAVLKGRVAELEG